MQLDKPPSTWDVEFFERWFQKQWRRDLQSTAVRTITASDTVDSIDSLIRADATAGNITVTLPTIRGQFGRPSIEVKKVDSSANTVTVSTANTTFTVDASTDYVYALTNDFDQTGIPVQLTNSGGALPAGLSTLTTYYTIYVSPKVFRLATSLANARAGTQVNITGSGTGTHTIRQIMDADTSRVLSSSGGSTSVVATEALSWDVLPLTNGSALTGVDDTNVTLTLGGTPGSALLAATSLTLGWTGQLALSRGGSNANLTASNGGVVYSDASKMQILGGTATANKALLSGSSAAPSWAGYAQPSSLTTGDLWQASSSSALSALAAVATGNALISGGVGTVSSWGKVGLTTHVSGILPEANGGTNQSTYTQGDVIYASAANALGKLGIGAAGKLLQSNGTTPGWSTPTWPTASPAAGTFPRGDGTNFVTSTLTVPNALTSGGVLYGSSANVAASSGALGSTQVVLGGGAGGAPNTSANLTFSGSTLALTGSQTISANLTVASLTSGKIPLASTAGLLIDGPAYSAGTLTGSITGNAATVTTNANLTGDVTSVGNATTLATVASAGTTGSSTAIPVVTINAKGLTTGITTAAVVAPAGTLTGSALASGVTSSSLTSFGASIALGTPASGVMTNVTGTASGLTAGSVTTNANLTGPITSSGNATAIASQTGTGTKFVVDTSPVLVTPTIGTAAATLINFATHTTSAGGVNFFDTPLHRVGAGRLREILSQDGQVEFNVTNGNSGTGAYANLSLSASGSSGNIYQFGGSYTTALTRFIQDSLLMEGAGAGGLGLSASGGPIKLWTGGGNLRVQIDNTTFSLPVIGTTANAANLYADNGASPANSVLRSTSSGRYKTGLELLGRDEAIDITLRMSASAMSYLSRSPHDDGNRRFLGITAEEMHQIDRRLVTYSHGMPESVQYERIPVVHSVVIADHELRLRDFDSRLRRAGL